MNTDLPKLNRRNFLSTLPVVGGALSQPFEDPEVEKSGVMVELLSPEGEIILVDQALLKPVPDHLPLREGIKGRKFVMVIDLSKCRNLKKCQAACSQGHHLTADKNWVKVYSMQQSEETAPYWQPTICMHCDEPPCVKVCPVDATFKRTDGIVGIDNDRCIGCRFCMAACPYSTRVFNWSESQLNFKNSNEHHQEAAYLPQLGTVEKCDFCPHMIVDGKLPHCVTACPNGVFYFGDSNEDAVTNGAETLRLSDLIKDKNGYQLMHELGAKPRVYYLPPVDRLFPYELGLEDETKQEE